MYTILDLLLLERKDAEKYPGKLEAIFVVICVENFKFSEHESLSVSTAQYL